MDTERDHQVDPAPEARPVPVAAGGRWRELGLSIVSAVAVFVVVLLAGVIFAVTRQGEWTAQATVMVAPDPALDRSTSASYYESLSRGQMVATAAEILGLQRFTTAAADDLRLTRAQQDQVTVAIRVVPDTTIIQVAATAPTAQLAEGMANSVVARAGTTLLPDPYVLVLMSSADRTARRSDPATPIVGSVVVLVALVAGLAAQQATHHLTRALGTGEPPRPGTAPNPSPAPLLLEATPAQPATSNGKTAAPGRLKRLESAPDSTEGIPNGSVPEQRGPNSGGPVRYVGRAWTGTDTGADPTQRDAGSTSP
jgi:capsular polysaccharide biosynthesis protein